MAERHDILHRLQEYEILPPPEAFVNLRNALNSGMKDGDALANGSISRLGQLEIQPPFSMRSSIESRIFKKRRTVSFYSYRAIAACLLLAAGVWLMYQMNNSSRPAKSIPALVTQKKQTLQPGIPETAAPAHDTIPGPAEQPLTANNTPAGSGITESPTSLKNRKAPAFSIDNRKLSMIDNDLLFTFASYKYDEIPAFMSSKEDRILKIHVDQYANIVISKTMSRMMKDMYQYKSKDRLTRRARKTRERLDQWKKKDEEQFDRSSTDNPLDPIDLAKFIF
jgi:hypothetical protein